MLSVAEDATGDINLVLRGFLCVSGAIHSFTHSPSPHVLHLYYVLDSTQGSGVMGHIGDSSTLGSLAV